MMRKMAVGTEVAYVWGGDISINKINYIISSQNYWLVIELVKIVVKLWYETVNTWQHQDYSGNCSLS